MATGYILRRFHGPRGCGTGRCCSGSDQPNAAQEVLVKDRNSVSMSPEGTSAVGPESGQAFPVHNGALTLPTLFWFDKQCYRGAMTRSPNVYHEHEISG